MAITNATRLSDFAAGIGTEGAILKIDNANQRVGIGTQLPNQMLTVAGNVSATQFIGDGSQLEGITSAGLGTAIDETEGSAGAVVYYTNDLLNVTETTTINPPASASAAYTQYRDVKLNDNVDLIIETGDDFIPDVLGLAPDESDPNADGNGVFDEVYTDIIKNRDGLGAPAFSNGLTSVGVITATGGFSGAVTGNLTGDLIGNVNNSDNVTIASDESDAVSNSSIIFKTDGTEKVRIVNSAGSGCVGISTGNIDPDGNKLLIRGASTIGTNKGHIMLTGDSSVVGEGPQIVFSESGPGANWAGAYIGHTRQGGGSVGDLRFGTRAATGDANTVPTERLRISSNGAIGIGGANYGTSGQVLTSGGASAAPSWATPSGGSWELVSTTYCPDLGGTQDNIDYVGLSTAYSAYKVQFTGCTFITSGGARSQDKVLAFLRNTSDAWVTANYAHRILRYDGGGGPNGYGVDENFIGLTHNDYVDVFSGELIIPMASNNVNSGYGDKLLYGDFQSDRNRIMFGCYSFDANIRTTGFNGIRLQSDDHKWYEGRVSLYRLKHT